MVKFAHPFKTLAILLMAGLGTMPSNNLFRTSAIAETEVVAGNAFLFNKASSSHMNFCGEAIPMENPTVKQQLMHEISQRAKYKIDSRHLIKRSHRYKKSFQDILAQEGVPSDFFYIAIAESGLSNATSHVGAEGFWQFMETTAKAYGLEVSETVDERRHPELATRAACKYFLQSYKVFNNWSLVAASYNMGISALNRAMERQDKDNLFDLRLNSETSRYLYRVVGIKEVFENPGQYGIYVHSRDLKQPIPYRIIKINKHIFSLSEFASRHETDLESLKAMNPWLISDRLIAKPGKTYHIRVPLVDQFSADELTLGMN